MLPPTPCFSSDFNLKYPEVVCRRPQYTQRGGNEALSQTYAFIIILISYLETKEPKLRNWKVTHLKSIGHTPEKYWKGRGFLCAYLLPTAVSRGVLLAGIESN